MAVEFLSYALPEPIDKGLTLAIADRAALDTGTKLGEYTPKKVTFERALGVGKKKTYFAETRNADIYSIGTKEYLVLISEICHENEPRLVEEIGRAHV